ncbi:DUF721 domain-containing protein [Porphyromonas macacae]|uniref:DUF721 domain-containing protein n=1 Tax=Porphyromonas macacae TaxID=28115 RepID=UPI0024ACE4C3|nr:DUF721 domain-containing protein [Porphyromonas macacae]
MRRAEPQRLGDVLDEWLTNEPELHERLMEAKLLQILPTAVGPFEKFIAKKYVRDGILYLRMHSAAARQQLMTIREELRQKLNEQVGVELLRDIDIR